LYLLFSNFLKFFKSIKKNKIKIQIMIIGNSNVKKDLSQNDYKNLKKIIKKYSNFYKALYLFDSALSAEYRKKNEIYMNENLKKKNKIHIHSDSQSNCCSGKIDNKSIRNLIFFIFMKINFFLLLNI